MKEKETHTMQSIAQKRGELMKQDKENHALFYAELPDQYKSLRATFRAYCPKCEKTYLRYGIHIGDKMPRVYCRVCRQAVKRLSNAVNF